MFIYFLKFIYVHYFSSFIKIFGKQNLDHFVLKKMGKKSNCYKFEVALNLKLFVDLLLDHYAVLQTTNSTQFCRLICTCTQAMMIA